MSVLLPSTCAVLATVPRKPGPPHYSNMIAAELFEAENTRGPFKLLRRADGTIVLFDTRAPNGKGVVGIFAGPTALEQGQRALKSAPLIAVRRGARHEVVDGLEGPDAAVRDEKHGVHAKKRKTRNAKAEGSSCP